MKRLPHFLLCFMLLIGSAMGNPAYSIKNIPDPTGAVIEAGGVDHWPDGTLVLSTRRGEVWTLKDNHWKRFASGLLEPMGISAGKVGEVYVVQTPELTRICDIDGDGSADRHETVTAGWEIPGATADFVYGLCRDKDGNFYGTFHTTHGPWAKKSLPPGISVKPGKLHARNSVNNFGGPMGAPVIGRGWSFQISPGGKLTWWSSGLRAPNGVAFNAAGDLFATDNQGDWVGTSAMHHIERGDFHGHPSSYFWDPKRTVSMDSPLDQLALKLDKLRKRPAVLFPHGILGNSPSQPALAPADGSFGPFAGQFFVGDNVAPLLSRVYLEKVGGEYQGACFPFIRGQGLRKALCRMTFSAEGKLVVAYGCRGWGPATTGLQEVSWLKSTPFEMQKINLQPEGFSITFTKPLAKQDLSGAITLRSFSYKYHHSYGSPQVGSKQLKVAAWSISPDRRVLTLKVSGLEAGKICEFKLSGVTAKDGSKLVNAEAYYTLNRMVAQKVPSSTQRREFFPICMDTHDASKRSLAEQARLFRELGYDGCGHICQDLGYGNITHPPNTTLEQRATSLEAEGLRMIHAYGRVYLENDQPIDLKRIETMMPTLKKHRTELVVLLLGNRKASLDDKAVAILGKIADIAKPHGVRISIYPHTGDYTQTVGEALRIVKKLNRSGEVGVMFTFGHWKNVDPEKDLRAILTGVKPWLTSVSINGTNKKGAAVLPLDQGDYDVHRVMEILDDLEFKGPVALMCWNIRGDARKHLEASMKQWKSWTAHVELKVEKGNCLFETDELKGRIGDGRFIGPNQVVQKGSGIKISGNGRANRHGLLTLYRVFTRNHRYGNAAYDWKGRSIKIEGKAVVLHWPATNDRPFSLEARYTFPSANQVKLQVTVEAQKDLTDFEVQVASYFDSSFPLAEVLMDKQSRANSPKKLGTWHAFPRDQGAKAIIEDGRWNHGPSPVKFAFREPFGQAVSMRKHSGSSLLATVRSPADDCFAIYTAHDRESHYSNYHALFGRTIGKGETATAEVTLTIR